MALRKAPYDKIEERGLFFRSYYVFPNKTREPFEVWRRSTYVKYKAERDEVGAVCVGTEGGGLSGGGRALWWTTSGLFWTDPDLTADEVTLLVSDRTRRTAHQLGRLAKIDEHGQSAAVDRRERIPDDVRAAVWHRDDGRCVYCGIDWDLQFDHIIPVAKGGGNSAENVQLLCGDCNRQKSDHIV